MKKGTMVAIAVGIMAVLWLCCQSEATYMIARTVLSIVETIVAIWLIYVILSWLFGKDE